MKRLLLSLLFVALPTLAHTTEQLVKPGESPQEALDRAAPGDKLVFLPGLHQHKLGKHRSLLYVDKPVDIVLQAGATLKLADNETKLESTPEITTDQDAAKKLDDLHVGGEFDLSSTAIYTIRIDSVGKDGQPDTFAWGGGDRAQSDGKLFETPFKEVPITGDWQKLDHGVKIRFGSKSGHSQGSLWFVSYDGPEAYGIRIGHGRQPDYIENVRITGKGTIDMNASHNIQPSFLVKNINACVLIHGRVRNVLVQDITMVDTNRSVMLYGEHTGEFQPGGRVGLGESFDAENITIQYTRTLNPHGAAYLLGHPSFRGKVSNVRCNHNYMETGFTAIEPNFNLDRYEVVGNVIKSGGQAIHCWRHSSNGVIADNLRIHDNTGKPVVVIGAPRGWAAPQTPILRNNRNQLSDRTQRDSERLSLAAEGVPNVFVYRDTCNSYVLRDGDAALLVNLGDGSVLEELKTCGVKNVEWILFTDHHRELCQGIHLVDRASTKVAAPRLEQELFESPLQFRKWRPTLNDKYTVHGASYVRPPANAIKLDRLLDAGDVFRWRGFDITCVNTPGTSPGGMSYVLRRGDQTIAFTGGVVHDGARMTNWYDIEWDYGFGKGLDTLIESVQRLRDLKLAIAFPSQGAVIRDANEVLGTYHAKLVAFRPDYLRGYPVNNLTQRTKVDPIIKPTAIPQIVQVTPHLYKFSDMLAGKNFAIIISDNGRGLLLDCGIFPESLLHDLVPAMQQHLGLKLHFDWMPGQTEFGNCLWLELDGRKIAFTGDNLFGDPSDPAQNGHEAVVARNSAIFEEGYILGSKYLRDLKPEIIMGAHNVLMTNPTAFVERYHEWSKRIAARYKELLPDRNYEYQFDPFWVSAYPYRVDLHERSTQEVTITVRNFRDQPQHHHIRLRLPPGITAEPTVLEGTVAAKSREPFKVTLKADATQTAAGVQMITFDITLDAKHYGELFDFLIQAKPLVAQANKEK
jgi:glyoxylase-like metal-dependent hydrolase (beta-lactamase superfamily II)